MSAKITYEKLLKLTNRVFKKYSSKVEMINELHQLGEFQADSFRHECMVMELLLLGKGFSSIKRVLLFTDDYFDDLVDRLYVFLKNYKKIKKRYLKLKGS